MSTIRNKKNVSTVWLRKKKQQQKKNNLARVYSTFNISTAPLIRPLLGSTKVVLIAEVYYIWYLFCYFLQDRQLAKRYFLTKKGRQI